MTMTEEEVTAFLAHYGVKGMRWGHRKKEVSAEKQAAREKRAAKFDLKAENAKTKISEIDAKLSKEGFLFGRRGLKKQKKDLQKIHDQAIKNAEAKRQGKLSSTQKKVIAGAAIAGVIVAGVAVHRQYDSGELNRKMMRGRAFLEGKHGVTWARNPDLSKRDMDVDEIMSKVVKNINPDFGKPGTTNNCRRATFAYEMRRRGMDVQATKTSSGSGQTFIGLSNAIGFGRKDIDKIDPGTKLKDLAEMPINSSVGAAFKTYGSTGRNTIHAGSTKTAPDSIFRALSNQPNRSRGELGVLWEIGGGHSMAYEIVNNKPVIFDTQSGKRFLNPKDLLDSFGENIQSAGFTRLDDVMLNENFIMRWVKNAK